MCVSHAVVGRSRTPCLGMCSTVGDAAVEGLEDSVQGGGRLKQWRVAVWDGGGARYVCRCEEEGGVGTEWRRELGKGGGGGGETRSSWCGGTGWLGVATGSRLGSGSRALGRLRSAGRGGEPLQRSAQLTRRRRNRKRARPRWRSSPPSPWTAPWPCGSGGRAPFCPVLPGGTGRIRLRR